MPRSRKSIPNVSIYKPAARSAKQHKWLIAYVEDGGREVESVSTDYQVTLQYAMQVSRRLDRKRLGLITDADARRAAAEMILLTEHVEEFAGWLVARGVTAKQAGEVKSRLLKLVEWCEFRRLSDLSPSKVQAGVNDWRDEHHRSAEICNKYLKAAKQFSKWLWRTEKRVTDHVFADLRGYNVEADRRHERRALTPAELALLLDAAARGEPYVEAYVRITGAERRMLYLLAAYTGLRRSELASLTPASFALGGASPTVTVEAAHSKHRRTDVVDLRADVAAELRTFLADRPPDAPAFPIPPKAFLMLYADLASAGIPVQTAEGVADFHALRHTFITLLGSDPQNNLKVVQQLARHSDIRLTARYMHMRRHDERRALDNLPALPAPKPAEQKATGTFGKLDDPPRPPPAGAQRPVERPTFPTGPAGSRSFPESAEAAGAEVRQNDAQPLATAETYGKIEGGTWRRPPEPKVAGSSPAGNAPVTPPPPAGSELPPAAPDEQPAQNSAPGAAPAGSTPAPALSAEQIDVLIAQLSAMRSAAAPVSPPVPPQPPTEEAP